MSKPVGEYQVRVVETEVTKDEQGKHRVVFHLEFEDGTPGQSKLNLFGGGLEIARRKLIALKFSGSATQLADNKTDFTGKVLKAKVKEWQGQNGRMNTDIELFLPDAGGKKVRGADLADIDLGFDVNDAGWLTQ